MVGLRKLKGKYYARIYLPDRREKLISLGTGHIREASVRRTQVEQHEAELRAGLNVVFPWQTGKAFSEVRHYTLNDAVSDFLKARAGDGIRESTLKIYEVGLLRFQKAVGKRLPVDRLDLEQIDKFRIYYQGKIRPETININLRSIRVFLHWLKDRNKIDSVPRIKIRSENHLPIYLTNAEFETILERVDPHFRRAFWFYRETGLRLAEPFNGEIDGNFLVIQADKYKGKKDHMVYLTPELKEIALEMQSMVDEKVRRRIATRTNAIQFYTKVFYKACQGDRKKGWEPIKNRKFHSLRHTSAVRLYLKTRDIYAVMKQLGHSSVTTTEIYSRFDIRLLEEHFPDLVKNDGKTVKMHVSDTVMPDTRIPAFS